MRGPLQISTKAQLKVKVVDFSEEERKTNPLTVHSPRVGARLCW